MSSNDYSACISPKPGSDEPVRLSRTSAFLRFSGRRREPRPGIATLGASFKPFPNFNSDREVRRLTRRQETTLLSL